MGLLQEWFLHETKNSEEEMEHRPQNEEINFYRAVSSGDMDAVRGCRSPFPQSGNQFKISFCNHNGICDQALRGSRHGNGTGISLK